jgi:hypothetical protein
VTPSEPGRPRSADDGSILITKSGGPCLAKPLGKIAWQNRSLPFEPVATMQQLQTSGGLRFFLVDLDMRNRAPQLRILFALMTIGPNNATR